MAVYDRNFNPRKLTAATVADIRKLIRETRRPLRAAPRYSFSSGVLTVKDTVIGEASQIVVTTQREF